MMELIGSLIILLGAFFLFSAGVGLLRMPDAFTRIQAGTRARIWAIFWCWSDWASIIPIGAPSCLSSPISDDDKTIVIACPVACRPRNRNAHGCLHHNRCIARRGECRQGGGRCGMKRVIAIIAVLMFAAIFFSVVGVVNARRDRRCRILSHAGSARTRCAECCDRDTHYLSRLRHAGGGGSAFHGSGERWCAPCQQVWRKRAGHQRNKYRRASSRAN